MKINFTDLLIKKSITKQKLSQTFISPSSLFQPNRRNPIVPFFAVKKPYIHQKQKFISDYGNLKYSKSNDSYYPRSTEKNIIGKSFLNLKSYIQNRRKPKTTTNKLQSLRIAGVDETKVSPLAAFIILQRKRDFLRQQKILESKNLKSYRGPRPRRFSQKAKNLYSKFFTSSFFWSLKKQSLRLVYLRRFFKWYFYLSIQELKTLQHCAHEKKHVLSFFISSFESRLVNLLLRSGLVKSPGVFPMLFKLGVLFVNGIPVTFSNFVVQPYQIVRIYSKLLPYSYYRVFYSKIRVFPFGDELAFFKQFLSRKRRFSRFFTFRFKLLHFKYYLRFFRARFAAVNWMLRYFYVHRRARLLIFLQKPLANNFPSFFYFKRFYLYNFLLKYC